MNYYDVEYPHITAPRSLLSSVLLSKDHGRSGFGICSGLGAC